MYQTRFVQKAAEIYERCKSEAASGPTGMLLKAFGPSVPAILRYIDEAIDEDPELRQKLGIVLKELSEALEDDRENKEKYEGGNDGQV